MRATFLALLLALPALALPAQGRGRSATPAADTAGGIPSSALSGFRFRAIGPANVFDAVMPARRTRRRASDRGSRP